MRLLITGASGFVGRHLAAHLLAETDAEVYGLDRLGRGEAENAAPAGVRRVAADLRDAAAVRSALATVRPDGIFHLAAQASVPLALADPGQTLVNNVLGQLHLLEAVAAECPAARVVVASSGEVYGRVPPNEQPVDERAPFRPTNPYAVSKVAQDALAYQYWVARGLATVRVRPFNHIGPGQSDLYAASSFARQIAEAELGRRPPVIQVGNLAAERDFTDVRDVVRAYYLALLHGEPGEAYNVGSERAVSLQTILNGLLGLSRVAVRVEVDPTRLRPVDVPRIVASCAHFRARTGWQPTLPLSQTLADTLDAWRAALGRDAASPAAPE
jgi:GDP-4-dehydro-6-deoxy-D-mannose reductase